MEYVVGVIAGVLVLWLAFVGVEKLVSARQAARRRRKARRELAGRSREDVLAGIDAEIGELEAKLADTRARAGELAGRFGVMGHVEGPASRLRELRALREVVIAEPNDR